MSLACQNRHISKGDNSLECTVVANSLKAGKETEELNTQAMAFAPNLNGVLLPDNIPLLFLQLPFSCALVNV